MEHPKDREFRKAYEQAVASGATTEGLAGWMNDQMSTKELKMI